MKLTRLFEFALASTLLVTGGKAFAAQYYYGPPSPPYGYDHAEQALEQRGFQDGVVGADRDFQNHRRPDVNNRDEYRDPHFHNGWAQHEYREGFRRGYYVRVRQIYANDYGDGPRYWYRAPY